MLRRVAGASDRETNVADHGDRAADFGFRTEDAEVSRASDGSAVVLLEAAFGLAGGSTPAPPGYPTARDRATFRPRKSSSMGIGAAGTPANHEGSRAAETRSDLRPETGTEASRRCRTSSRASPGPRINRPRKFVLVLSEAVLVIVIAGDLDALLCGAPAVIIESFGGVNSSQGRDGLDYEHEHRRKRLSTSTIGSAGTDERNAGIHVAAGLQVAVRKSRCRPLTCNSLVRRFLDVGYSGG